MADKQTDLKVTSKSKWQGILCPSLSVLLEEPRQTELIAPCTQKQQRGRGSSAVSLILKSRKQTLTQLIMTCFRITGLTTLPKNQLFWWSRAAGYHQTAGYCLQVTVWEELKKNQADEEQWILSAAGKRLCSGEAPLARVFSIVNGQGRSKTLFQKDFFSCGRLLVRDPLRTPLKNLRPTGKGQYAET